MKKMKYLVALVVVILAMATTTFAFTMEGTVTGATLDTNNVIEYDPAGNGFIFQVLAEESVKMSTMTVNIANLLDDGWTIEPVDGLYCFDASANGAMSYTGTQLQPKLAMSPTGHDCVGKPLVQFKATPGPSSVIDGVTFTVTPIIMPVSGTAYTTAETYTLAKKSAPAVIPSTATVTGAHVDGIVGASGAVYDNVWVGGFTITLGNDNVIGVYAKYNGEKTTDTYEIDGEGTVEANIAIVGAPADAVVEAVLVK